MSQLIALAEYTKDKPIWLYFRKTESIHSVIGTHFAKAMSHKMQTVYREKPFKKAEAEQKSFQ